MAADPATAKAAAAAGAEAKEHWPQIIFGALAALFSMMMIVLFPIVVLVMTATKIIQWFEGDTGGVPRGPDAALISEYAPMYRAAASEYGVNWYLLASIHKQESSFSTGSAQGIRSGVNSYGCCGGPMQFNLTNGSPSTWDVHKNGYKPIKGQRPSDYPLQRDRHPSPYDDFDAIAAAAHKLKADGATRDLYSQGTYDAVCAYIGSCSNVANCGGPNDYCQVLPRAREWAKSGMAEAAPPGDLPGGPRDDVGRDSVFPTFKRGTVITTHFGAIDALHLQPHTGMDLANVAGTPVYAFHAGIVSLVEVPGNTPFGYGNYVCIDHPDLRVASCSAHLLTGSVQVREGQTVRKGDAIAAIGSTGRSTGPHLHFEIRGRNPDVQTGRYRFACPAEYIGLDPAKTCDLSFY